ncbi:hypothetical protein SUVZ_02G4940 [Saccharomyces uvarum]|uniref:RRM domain-containing protein n=1 Tax=Saccharomyces uvarum TaxID=230603 RepID=A0ABN8WP75_SACUV|nr:hypothetical protein SUVZ_02G4940 [Saccharomyces uvarum]
MSANLDKSLDEIIGSSRPGGNRVRVGGTRGNGPKRVGKQINTQRRNVPNRNGPIRKNVRPPPNAVARVAKLLDTSREVKVNVEGLPRDIKQDAVREFFASQVGGVQRVLLSYNERGQSTGMANITFKNGDLARRAVERFNGSPIDGGRSRLRLNLIVDPNQRPTRSLADRIKAMPQKSGNAPRPVKRGPNRKAAMVKTQNKQKRERPAKKSLEDLDKEMADYFEKK